MSALGLASRKPRPKLVVNRDEVAVERVIIEQASDQFAETCLWSTITPTMHQPVNYA